MCTHRLCLPTNAPPNPHTPHAPQPSTPPRSTSPSAATPSSAPSAPPWPLGPTLPACGSAAWRRCRRCRARARWRWAARFWRATTRPASRSTFPCPPGATTQVRVQRAARMLLVRSCACFPTAARALRAPQAARSPHLSPHSTTPTRTQPPVPTPAVAAARPCRARARRRVWRRGAHPQKLPIL